MALDFTRNVGDITIALIDLHIAYLLPSEPKPVRKDTSAYRLNNGDIDKLTDIISKTVRDAVSD